MGRTRGPDYVTRPCPECGAKQRVEIDTNGHGGLVETPLPCANCAAGARLPEPGPVRGKAVVPIAVHVLRKDPKATSYEVYDAIVGLGYKLSMTPASFVGSGYFHRARVAIERTTARAPTPLQRTPPRAPVPVADSQETPPGRMTFEVRPRRQAQTPYRPSGAPPAPQPFPPAAPSTAPVAASSTSAEGKKPAVSAEVHVNIGQLRLEAKMLASGQWEVSLSGGIVDGELMGKLFQGVVRPLVAEVQP